MNADGSGRRKVVDYAIGTPNEFSRSPMARRDYPAIRWSPGRGVDGDSDLRRTAAANLRRGVPPRVVSRRAISLRRDQRKSRTSAGRTIVLPVAPDTGLPDLPRPGSIPFTAALIRGSRIVELTEIAPGLDPDTYAYVKGNVQRNLFRIPRLPD